MILLDGLPSIDPAIAIIVLTFLYTLAALWLVWESRKLRKVQSDPIVYLGVEDVPNPRVAQFFVQNVGQGVAYDVEFDVIRDFKEPVLLPSIRLADAGLMKNTLTLGPSQKITFAAINPTFNSQIHNQIIEVAVRYRNKPSIEQSIMRRYLAFLLTRKPTERRYPIDFAYFEEMTQITPPSVIITDNMKSIAQSVDMISKELKKHETGTKRGSLTHEDTRLKW